MVRGKVLSRREHNLLVRVLADLLRLLPLAFFVLVPFMEFALPFAIRIFPNLLPSTFEEKHLKEDKMKKLLKVRLEVAQVLGHTLEERAVQLKRERDAHKGHESSSKELRHFMSRLREGGHAATPEELLRMMAMFKDQLTLDSMDRPQLVSMCQFMGLQHFGPDGLLRWTLRTRMRQLRNDDKDILWEGVSALTKDELRHAMRARGLPTKGLDTTQMRDALQEWVSLSQKADIGSCVLLLVNMYRFSRIRHEQGLESAPATKSEAVIDMDAAETAMTSMSEGALNSAISEAREVSPKEALELLEREQELVEEEYLLRMHKPQEAPSLDEQADREHEARLSREQVHDIALAVETMSVDSAYSRERQEMITIEQERLANREEVEMAVGAKKELAMLDKRVNKMLDSLRTELEQADGSIGKAFRSLDLDGDGVLSAAELLEAMNSLNVKMRPQAEQFKQVLKQLDPDDDGKINVADLSRLISEIQLRDADPDERPRLKSAAEK